MSKRLRLSVSPPRSVRPRYDGNETTKYNWRPPPSPPPYLVERLRVKEWPEDARDSEQTCRRVFTRWRRFVCRKRAERRARLVACLSCWKTKTYLRCWENSGSKPSPCPLFTSRETHLRRWVIGWWRQYIRERRIQRSIDLLAARITTIGVPPVFSFLDTVTPDWIDLVGGVDPLTTRNVSLDRDSFQSGFDRVGSCRITARVLLEFCWPPELTTVCVSYLNDYMGRTVPPLLAFISPTSVGSPLSPHWRQSRARATDEIDLRPVRPVWTAFVVDPSKTTPRQMLNEWLIRYVGAEFTALPDAQFQFRRHAPLRSRLMDETVLQRLAVDGSSSISDAQTGAQNIADRVYSRMLSTKNLRECRTVDRFHREDVLTFDEQEDWSLSSIFNAPSKYQAEQSAGLLANDMRRDEVHRQPDLIAAWRATLSLVCPCDACLRLRKMGFSSDEFDAQRCTYVAPHTTLTSMGVICDFWCQIATVEDIGVTPP